MSMVHPEALAIYAFAMLRQIDSGDIAAKALRSLYLYLLLS